MSLSKYQNTYIYQNKIIYYILKVLYFSAPKLYTNNRTLANKDSSDSFRESFTAYSSVCN